MTFEEYLTKRRIGVAAFAAGDSARYAEWKEMYAQMHPNSFYVSVKMVLNDVRRKFWLAEAAKPIVTADAPAKPVTRRASIPGAGAAKPEIKPPVAVHAPEPTEPKPNTAPGKGRAVIPRTAPAKTETPVASEPTSLASDKPASEEALKTPRARPVIRRPTPTAESTNTPATEKEQIAQDGTNAAAPFHTNPNPEEEAAPKPPRPRPVFRKPVTANSEEKPVIAETPDKSLPTENVTVATVTEQTKAEEAKPPRPRPIFKRPVENTNAADRKPDPTTPEADKPNLEVQQETENNVASPAAKPPRPRPVIRRPNTVSEPLQPIVPPEVTPPENNKQGETPALPVVEPPKPPRPRPVFKRPAKPDDLKE